MKKINPYLGKWRFVEMEMWDQEYIDMETEGYFLFEKDESGSFQFGLVQGQIDYQIEKTREIERLEFSWEGRDENDEATGRGWALIKNDHLEGRFYFHSGDNSWFKAKKYR
ncbi:MAG: hypothetical protein C4518_19235 [Desulfobacteraceae bacterium]|nr:MAG: hypothetical protein C4518_19235 [Desulfobacteraceae bacterium]